MSNKIPRMGNHTQERQFFEHLTITSGKFSDTNFEGCQIRNVKLSGCSVSDGSLDHCKLLCSEVGRLQYTFDDKLYNSWARDCEITECKLTNVDILRSRIVIPNWESFTTTPPLGMLSQCRIQTSHVEADDVKACLLTKCQVITYDAHRSTFKDCEVELRSPGSNGKRSLREFIIKKTPLAFQNFPPEIRIIIFANELHDAWSGDRLKVPALIAALRAHSQLHKEALAIFCSFHTFNLSSRNWRSRKHMGAPAFQSIRHITLDASIKNAAQVPSALLGSTNLQDLEVIIPAANLEVILDINSFVEIIRNCTMQAAFLNKVSRDPDLLFRMGK